MASTAGVGFLLGSIKKMIDLEKKEYKDLKRLKKLKGRFKSVDATIAAVERYKKDLHKFKKRADTVIVKNALNIIIGELDANIDLRGDQNQADNELRTRTQRLRGKANKNKMLSEALSEAEGTYKGDMFQENAKAEAKRVIREEEMPVWPCHDRERRWR